MGFRLRLNTLIRVSDQAEYRWDSRTLKHGNVTVQQTDSVWKLPHTSGRFSSHDIPPSSDTEDLGLRFPHAKFVFALVVEETCNRSWLPRVLELIDLGVAEVLAVVHIIFWCSACRQCSRRSECHVTVLGALDRLGRYLGLARRSQALPHNKTLVGGHVVV